MIASFLISIFLPHLMMYRYDLIWMEMVEECIYYEILTFCFVFCGLLDYYDVQNVCLLIFSLTYGLMCFFFVKELKGFLFQKSRPFLYGRIWVVCIVLGWAFCCLILEGGLLSYLLFLLLGCGIEISMGALKLHLLLFSFRGWIATFLIEGQLHHLESRIWTISELDEFSGLLLSLSLAEPLLSPRLGYLLSLAYQWKRWFFPIDWELNFQERKVFQA